MTSNLHFHGERVRDSLTRAAQRARDLDLPVPPLEGKLLRPLVAYLAVPEDRRESLGESFWMGALAVQMVHEASLYHDDILDEAQLRRGRETLVAEKGLARALVEGDHLLTASYRAALLTGSFDFAQCFAHGVERTVAGEKLQGALAGRTLDRRQYNEVVEGKSGELFGCAVALGTCLSDPGAREDAYAVGLYVGRLYQMVDDFLDYCPNADMGKAAYQDHRQGKWTWILDHCPSIPEDASQGDLSELLFGVDHGRGSAMRHALDELAREADSVWSMARSLGAGSELGALLESWVGTARRALEAEEEALAAGDAPEDAPEAESGDWLPYFAQNSRTFRFAARFFPPEEERLVAGVYAFCRFTDDLVDGREDLPAYQLERRLDGWRALVREAYDTGASGVPLLDEVMGEAARRGVPLRYAMELLDGVAMDIRPREYATFDELRTYTYRVASVVGLWVTELFGVHDPLVLERAAAMGHAMQLTNILRDVGEDWRMGRLYLPRELMERHGVSTEDLRRMVEEGLPPTEGYVALLEALMSEADRHYDLAMEAVPALPAFYRRPVAVAARVYQGIQDRIRANGHDNLTRRAFTRTHHKVLLGGRALWELRSLKRRSPFRATQRPDAPGLRRLMSPEEEGASV